MLKNFPTDYTVCSSWTWADWQSHLQILVDTDVNADTIEDWLAGWKILDNMANEVFARLQTAVDVDTTDEEAEAKYKTFIVNIVPEMEKIEFVLNKKLVASDAIPDELTVPVRALKASIKNFREENLPLQTKLQGFDIDRSKIVGAQTVQWDGEESTITALQTVFREQDRERRKKAWYLMQERLWQDKEAMDNLWKQNMDARLQLAKNAGFDDYRSYKWEQLGRFDYSPDDALQFCEAIAEVVVPAAERLREKGRLQLGYDSLRPWDMIQHSFGLAVDPLGREALKPYDTIEELIDKGVNIFQQVDPELGNFFAIMRDENLLDLDNRKGKAPGGYCNAYPVSKRPVIFMNSVGLDDDVTTLLHEAGHAFHVFSTTDMKYHMPAQFNHIPMEFAEVGSMAMELLATPYLTEDKGGYFSPTDSAQYRADHLRGIIYFWPYMALTVEFQHWIYTNHEAASDPDNCDAKYLELWHKYIKGIDWGDDEKYIVNRWRKQGHIFGVPFYYIEYGLAQLGAVQVWANSLENQQTALEQYRQALSLGGTATLPELFEAAGAKLSFDAETLQKAIDLIESTIHQLDPVQ